MNLCLQWWGIPVADDVNAKLDYLEANGYQAVEVPSDLGWLRDKGLKVAESLKNRKLFLATACGGSSSTGSTRRRTTPRSRGSCPFWKCSAR